MGISAQKEKARAENESIQTLGKEGATEGFALYESSPLQDEVCN